MFSNLSKLKQVLIGKPKRSSEAHTEKLGKFRALAVLSSDALSSVAYGTEQILLALMVVGVAALWFSVPISFAVLALLLILIISYRQTIFAYPGGGGAYIVAKDNLGTNTSLLAGGSLLIDYILTVAVSSSAGTDAITSAFPALHDYQVWIAVAMIIFLTVLNLRGITESATVLSYPVYLFVGTIFLVIICGIYQVVTGTATVHEASQPATTLTGGITLFLLLKAFSSGCSALTGVEAVSNAIPNFKNPAEKNAVQTLIWMGILLGTMFLGITLLAYWFHIVPDPKETVVSQISADVFGRGIFYYLVQGSTALILFLAANTAFVAFPLLAYMMAKDKFMPNMFMIRGDRLGYSNGIIVLGLFSIILVVLFHGDTSSLIPLYAIGVFIPFTLSQFGMMIRWFRLKPPNWQLKFAVNLVGMLTTLTITLIFIFTKFGQVWSVFLFLPIVIFIFHQINKHYREIGDQLRIDISTDKPVVKGSTIIVPVAGVTRVVMNTIGYAKSISDHVVAVYIAFDEESEAKMKALWKEWNPGVPLKIRRSPYRSLLSPLLKFIESEEWKTKESEHLTVLIPQFITKHWWHNFLHNQSGFLIRAYLFAKKDITVATYPYHLHK